jgi:hypothetical protein
MSKPPEPDNNDIDAKLCSDVADTLKNLRTCVGAISAWWHRAGDKIPRGLRLGLLTPLTLVGGELARLENLLSQIDPRLDEAIAELDRHGGQE